jgi:hypothetical protein
LGELRVFSLAGSELGKALAAGFIEVTNGVSLLSETAPVKLALISAAGAVSWGGLSIHAQSVSLFAHTDIKAAPYFFAKALHAVLGTAWAAVLYPLYEWLKSKDAAPVFSTFADAVFPVQQLQYSSKIFFQSLLILFSASLLIIFIRKLSRR